MTALRLLLLSATCVALASCENMKKSGGGVEDPYASNYGNDGHYNPYPGQSGYAKPSTTPSYQTPPAQLDPEPVPDPYAFNAAKKSPSSSGSSSSSKSTTKKSTASGTSSKKPSSSSKSTAKKKASGGSRYTVTKGDTLYGIARKKGTTVAKIKSANGLSGDIIRPGQSLKIP